MRLLSHYFTPPSSRVRLLSATLLAVAGMEVHAASITNSGVKVAVVVSTTEETNGVNVETDIMGPALATGTGGIAITYIDRSTGTWSYSTDRISWVDITATNISDSNAVLLPKASYLRFKRSDQSQQGYASTTVDDGKPFLTFMAFDVSGSFTSDAGSTINPSTYSGSFSLNYTGNLVLKKAPTIKSANTVISAGHGLVVNGTSGQPASTGLSIDEFIADDDISPYYGMAISQLSNGLDNSGFSLGRWEIYVPFSGWTPLNSPTPGFRRLSTSSDQPPKIRFNYTSGSTPLSYPSLSFYGWDQTNNQAHYNGEEISQLPPYSEFGAFSSSVSYLTVNLTQPNRPPVLTNDTYATLPAVLFNQEVAPTISVVDLAADFSDDDNNLINEQVLTIPRFQVARATLDGQTNASNYNLGIVVVGANTDHGSWKFSPDNGTTWIPFGTVSTTNALFLDPSDQVRFVPSDDHFDGPIASALTYHGWDGTGITRAEEQVGQETWRFRALPTFTSTGAISEASQTASMIYNATDATLAVTLLPRTLAIVNQPFVALVAGITSRESGHAVLEITPSDSWLRLTDLGNGTARLEGTPTSVGSELFTITARDSVKAANTTSQSVTITVLPASTTTLPSPTIPKTGANDTPKFTTIAGSTPEGLASIKAAFAGLDHTQARAFWWDAVAQGYKELPDDDGLTLQHALFVVSRVDLPISLSGQPAANPGELELKPGWNFLTIPPLTDGKNVSAVHEWTDAEEIDATGKITAPNHAKQPYGFDGTEYAHVTSLTAGSGYWFLNDSGLSIRLRFDGVVPAAAGIPRLAAASAKAARQAASANAEPPPPPNLSAPTQTSSASTGGSCGLGSGVAGIGLMLFAALRALFTGTRNRR